MPVRQGGVRQAAGAPGAERRDHAQPQRARRGLQGGAQAVGTGPVGPGDDGPADDHAVEPVDGADRPTVRLRFTTQSRSPDGDTVIDGGVVSLSSGPVNLDLLAGLYLINILLFYMLRSDIQLSVPVSRNF